MRARAPWRAWGAALALALSMGPIESARADASSEALRRLLASVQASAEPSMWEPGELDQLAEQLGRRERIPAPRIIIARRDQRGWALSGAIEERWKEPALEALRQGASLAALISGAGAQASCALLASERPRGGPESMLAGAIAREMGGGPLELKKAWRLLARHELGHCALARAAQRRRPGEQQERFADLYAAQWELNESPKEGALRAQALRAARQRLEPVGALWATSSSLARWQRSARAGEAPCAIAWKELGLSEADGACAAPR